ncbi:AMP-binding protein [Alloalcanivorax mobilis]|uniref:AMP-binding protein n=1 Tax=Alloalcanivorax mobilis TaxID=2019569 RepID=UPI000C780DE9|nr:AMP-binding protein [Alloalcanivorax mobilis]
MSNTLLSPPGLLLDLPDQAVLAMHAGEPRHGQRLRQDVAALAGALAAHPARDWGLFHDHGYPALVALLALWQSGKRAWLPGNNQPGTEQALGRHCQALLGDWPRPTALPTGTVPLPAGPLDADAELVIFTSGSSGEPQAISKRYRQLFDEVAILEQAFGAGLGGAAFAGTVSHQHIYGLLFRLLWPLASGRTVHSETLQDPASVLALASAGELAWVASPAHLKRLPDDLPWASAGGLQAVFSSGGPLPEDAALALAERAGQAAIEVYGSSETGGIAWRRQGADNDDAWTPLPGVRLEPGPRGATLLRSPHLGESQPWPLADAITLRDDGRFHLGARLDRIVKVEEKRVSLSAVEQALLADPAVAEARALQPAGEQRLGAVLVLSAEGETLQREQGRAALIRRLRQRLAANLETIAVPRRWRLVAALPETGQGKVPMRALQALFKHSQARLPEPGDAHWSAADQVTVSLGVAADLPWFSGHFPGQPVLPGVVQIDWAEGLARRYFELPDGGYRLQALKFHDLILPGAELQLTLQWQASTGTLRFAFRSRQGPHSSARLVFEEPR